jgi:L-lactate dehydrogenase complex protein LldG
MSARENILRRVRSALGVGSAQPERRAQDVHAMLSGHARGPMPAMDWDLIARFKERCIGLSSSVDEAASLHGVPAAVAKYVQSNALPAAACCWQAYADFPWKEAGLNVEFRSANADDKTGITGCFCAIAETGTLMTLSGEASPLTNSLLPDTHVAIVPRARIVRSMEDAWDLLRGEHGKMPRQVSFVSGPSRTADIEMTMVLGIHGPYRVHIVLV